MTLLRSILFNTLYVLWNCVYFTWCLLFLLLPPRHMLWAGRYWGKVIFFLLRLTCGIRHEVRGLERLPKDGRFIFACKHQSAWETIALLVYLDNPCYVLKKELLKIPFFGWFLKHGGVIAIDRAAGMKALKQMIVESREAVEQGRPVVIFPEGTRSQPGKPGEYHSGIAALYSGLDVPVYPAALNSGVCWGRNAFFKKPGKIVLEVLPPIEPGLKKKAFMEELESTVETASNRLLEEA